jgi:hypothetical protein
MSSSVACRILTACLLGSLLAFTLSAPAAAAGKRVKPKPDGAPAAGMYGNYVDQGPANPDKYLGDAGELGEAQLLPAIMSALYELSKYPKADVLPEIHKVSQERLQALACTGRCGVLGTYRPGEGIYLDERLKPETNLFHRSVLLHELVHYLQDLNNELGDMRPCERWYHREQEAYAIQKTYLVLVGSPVRVGYSASRPTCDN